MDKNEIKDKVRENYANIAVSDESCCYIPPSASSCCQTADDVSKEIGYSEDELQHIPDGANMGLGCGNPTALASLQEGEVVLDLGSGGGIDCFLAAQKVGKKGRVIGVDMTQEMIDKAKRNAKKTGYENVEFRLGDIEALPVDDNSVDVIISNCVINLAPSKENVFREALRVLKPGGRLMVSDIVLEEALPEAIRDEVSMYVGCISGASVKGDYLAYIDRAGFENTEIVEETSAAFGVKLNEPMIIEAAEKLRVTPGEVAKITGKNVKSIKVRSFKPAG